LLPAEVVFYGTTKQGGTANRNIRPCKTGGVFLYQILKSDKDPCFIASPEKQKY